MKTVYVVIGSDLGDGDWIVNICESFQIAEEIRDWCEAMEYNRVLNMNAKYKTWCAGVSVGFTVDKHEVVG